jgi:hypothetical protein
VEYGTVSARVSMVGGGVVVVAAVLLVTAACPSAPIPDGEAPRAASRSLPSTAIGDGTEPREDCSAPPAAAVPGAMTATVEVAGDTRSIARAPTAPAEAIASDRRSIKRARRRGLHGIGHDGAFHGGLRESMDGASVSGWSISGERPPWRVRPLAREDVRRAKRPGDRRPVPRHRCPDSQVRRPRRVEPSHFRDAPRRTRNPTEPAPYGMAESLWR